MPFGLTNTSATFQFTMNQVLELLLRRFVVVFFDDILIYSQSEEEHIKHLGTVLSTIGEHKFFLRKSKCEFAVTWLQFLGHIITTEGTSPDLEKNATVESWPTPWNVKEVRSFLGLLGFYHCFISRYELAAPLTELLKKSEPFTWGDRC